MVVKTNFILKLKALLHDPVHKIWSFSNVSRGDIRHIEVLDSTDRKWHEKVALDLFKFILEEDLDDDNVKKSDQIASAFSRVIVAPDVDEEERIKFDEETSINFNEAIYFDPFKCEEIKPIGHPDQHYTVTEIFEKIGDLSFINQEERAKFAFLFLWRFLPDILPWVNTHPADSRAPNHSIYDHLVQTSSIATCLEYGDKPSLLLFTLTPVQSFIANARKTSDLWAGSYLLSYFIYKAMETIIDEFGPDQIIFPNLRGQPLVDLWLYEKHFKEVELDIDAFIEWKREWFNFKEGRNEEIGEKLSIANIPNRFLAILPYNRARKIVKTFEKKIKDTIDEMLESVDEDDIRLFKKEIKEQTLAYLKPYWVVVPFYKDSYADIEAIIEEYKNLVSENELVEVIETIKEHPYYRETSNVGICYSLVVELAERFLASRKMVKDFKVIPPQKGEKCHLCGEYDALEIFWPDLALQYVNKSERLCGVCLFKRVLPEVIKQKFGMEIKFPSTSEMATVTYKTRLDGQKTVEFLKKFNEMFGQNKPQGVSVPALRGTTLYRIEGQWLMESSYRRQYLKEEFGVDIDETTLEDMKKFLKEKRINPPTYYAILLMDGDNMGKWLNGAFLPRVKDLIHPKMVEILESYSERDERLDILLSSNHPISPSFHNQFSRSLSEFALKDVREIVEVEYYGKLIYSGGDDILAFLPVEEAIDCAYKLNKKFKEILGEKASMSAGIVFVHHKYPLSLALNEVREAERLAKERYGRNSFCVKYITGSGQSRITGMKWEEKGFFDELITKYLTKELSSKFAYDFMGVIKELGSTNYTKNEILENELKRLYRHKLTKEKYDREFEERLIKELDRFRGNYEAFGDMLVITRFIASVSEEV